MEITFYDLIVFYVVRQCFYGQRIMGAWILFHFVLRLVMFNNFESTFYANLFFLIQTWGKDRCSRQSCKQKTAVGEYIFRFNIHNLKYHSLYHTKTLYHVEGRQTWQNNRKWIIKYDWAIACGHKTKLKFRLPLFNGVTL